MKKIQEKINKLSLLLSAAAAVMAFIALVFSIIALVKSCRKGKVTAVEYVCRDGGEDEFYDDDEDDGTLVF